MVEIGCAPRVTVGITCFNAEATIKRAIMSAKHQDWPNVEIIVVDDCSSDKSIQLIQETLCDFPEVRLICHHRNLGVAAARNTIIDAATGDYIAFFDDDDESYQKRISTQINKIFCAQVDPNSVLCFASGSRIYPNGYQVSAKAIGSVARPPFGDEVLAYLLLNERISGVFYGAGVPSCALMAPVSLLKSLGGYDESLRRLEDVDLAIRGALSGVHFIGCSDPLYLQHSTLGSDKTPFRNLEAELMIVEKYRTWLEERQLHRYAQKWFKFRESWFSGRKLESLLRAVELFLMNPHRTVKKLRLSGPKRAVHEWNIKRNSRLVKL